MKKSKKTLKGSPSRAIPKNLIKKSVEKVPVKLLGKSFSVVRLDFQRRFFSMPMTDLKARKIASKWRKVFGTGKVSVLKLGKVVKK